MRSISKGAAVAIAGSAVGLFAAAMPASAASSFVTPSDNPHTIPVDNNYNALPFDVTVTGYASQTSVFIEICNGVPSTNPGWSPGIDCDISTSPSPVKASTSGTASFPASNINTQIGDFNGVGPSDNMNCLSDNEIQAFGDATPAGAPGEWNLGPNDTQTAQGQPVDPSQPAWDNCQLRASSNNSAVTTDQVFITLTIPSTFPYTPEAPLAILLPIGAAGLLVGGLVLNRRRRSVRAAA